MLNLFFLRNKKIAKKRRLITKAAILFKKGKNNLIFHKKSLART